MRTSRRLGGDLEQYDAPDWQPLLDAIGEHLTGFFMWMHEIRLDDGTAVHAYKDKLSRCYLHLDRFGRAFDYQPGYDADGECEDYVEIPLAYAMAGVFWRWPVLFGVEQADLAEVERVISKAPRRFDAGE